MKRKLFFLFFLLLSTSYVFGEGKVVDFLRSTGKIYSVVAVIVVVFLGLAAALWRIDRKISKLEKQIKDE